MPGLRRFSLVALALADRWPRAAASPEVAEDRRKVVEGLRADLRLLASFRDETSGADTWFEKAADELEWATHLW